MTIFTFPNEKTGFAQLRHQFTTLVSDSPVPTDQIGKLPESLTHLRKRGTLHLNESVKKATT